MLESPTPQVLVADEFKRQLRNLAKRYRQIRQDIQPGTGSACWDARIFTGKGLWDFDVIAVYDG